MDRKMVLIFLFAFFLFSLPTLVNTTKPEVLYSIFGVALTGCLVITEKTPRRY